MANKKISELTIASLPLTGAEQTPIVQDGETRKVAVSNLVGDVKNLKFIPQDFDFTNINVSYADSTWWLTYDYDLGGNTITIPENVTLKFNDGSFSNGEIVGDNTSIDASLDTIFYSDLVLNGVWNIDTVYTEWFGSKISTNATNTTTAIQRTIDFSDLADGVSNIVLTKGKYYINNTITIIDQLKTLKISGGGTLTPEDGFTGFLMKIERVSNYDKSNMLQLEQIIFDGRGISKGLKINKSNRWVLSQCFFEYCVEGLTLSDTYYGEVSTHTAFYENVANIVFEAGDTTGVDGEVNNISFDNIKIGGNSTYGLDLRCVSLGVSFSNCSFEGIDTVFNSTVTNSLSGFVYYLNGFVVSECYFEACNVAFNFFRDSYTRAFSFQFLNNFGHSFGSDTPFNLKMGTVEMLGNTFDFKDKKLYLDNSTANRNHIKCDEPILKLEVSDSGRPTSIIKPLSKRGYGSLSNNYKYGGGLDGYPTNTSSYQSLVDKEEVGIGSVSITSNTFNSNYQTLFKNTKDIVYDKLVILNDGDHYKGQLILKAQNNKYFSIIVNNDGSLGTQRILEPRFKTLDFPYSSIEAYRRLSNGEYTDGDNAGIFDFKNSELAEIDAGEIVLKDIGGKPRVVVVGNISELTTSAPASTYSLFKVFNTDIQRFYEGHSGVWYMETYENNERAVGTTAQRPTGINEGFKYYDTDLTDYVEWNGTSWV